MKKEKSFKVEFNVNVTVDMLKNEKFDAIITATGSSQVGLPIKGAVQKHVCSAVEALKDYYTKAVSYGEFATSPSGNLINYTSNFSAFETILRECSD